MTKLDMLKPFTVERPEPIIGAKTIQLILMREVLDYTVLRTEETRELNTVATPLSVSNTKDALRVAFLATKQKAAESRQLEQLLRTAALEAKMDTPNGPKGNGCYLKDNLCLGCPRCGLFGGTSVESGVKIARTLNTALSILPVFLADVCRYRVINDL